MANHHTFDVNDITNQKIKNMKKLLTLLVLLLCTFNLCVHATGEVYTVSFNGSDAQSTAGYFTFSDKHNINTKYTGNYDGVTYTAGLKMESATTITFKSTATSTVTIVQSLAKNDGNNIAFDGNKLSGRVDDTTSKVGVYTIENLDAGTHVISRGSGEAGILFVKVEYTGAVLTVLATPTITFDSANGEVTIAQTDNADVYYTTDGTEPSSSNGTKYEAPFTAADGTVVKAVAVGDGTSTTNSSVASQTVLLTTVAIELPVVKSFNGSVAISCATANTKIEYALDGADYVEYTRSFTVTKDVTIKARASRDNCTTVETDEIAVKAVPANTKSKTIYMGFGSFTTSDSGLTLVGKEGDDAYGYSLKTISGKTFSGASKIAYDGGTRTAIKASNGAQTTMTLPEGVKATKLTLYSYVNYAIDKNCGWKEVNGTDYTEQVNDIPMGSTDASNPDVRIFPLDNVEGTITFTNAGLQLCFIIALDVIESEEVSVSSAGLASYCSANALDFSGQTDVEAYVAASYTGNVVNMQKVEQVPANTGIILKSVSGDAATVSVPIVESATAPAANLLVGITAETSVEASADGSYNYIFANGTSGVGFYKLTAAHTLAAGKAYLHTTEDLLAIDNAKSISMSFGGETTGISNVSNKAQDNGAYYTLSGLRVDAPTKGLYIKNGKKVIVK
jgi:hypothetical protein